jgi:hypothetical protein
LVSFCQRRVAPELELSRSRHVEVNCLGRFEQDDLNKLLLADHESALAGQARYALRATSLGHQQAQSRAIQPLRALDPQAGDNGFIQKGIWVNGNPGIWLKSVFF